MCSKDLLSSQASTPANSNMNGSSVRATNTSAASNVASKQSTKQSRSMFPLVAVLTLAALSAYSALLQLEKVYFSQKQTILPHIPLLSQLAFQQSIMLCSINLLVLVAFIYHQLTLLTYARLNMPRVPSPLPILGTALDFLHNSPWDLLESWHDTLGSIYTFTLLGRQLISIAEPEFIKQVLQSQIQNVKKDVNFSYKPFLSILGTGIVTSEGKEWMSQRRKVSQALKIDILEAIPNATLQAVQRLCAKIDDSSSDEAGSSSGVALDLAEELRHLTLQVISDTFLSLSAEESDSTFAKMYLPIVEESNKRVWRPERRFLFFAPCFWNYHRGVLKLNAYVSKLIVERFELRKVEKASGKKLGRSFDVLDKVLHHYESEHKGRTNMSRECIRQLRDEFKTFMLAGHETSAAMMTWALYELMMDEDLVNQMNEEAEQVFEKTLDWKEVGLEKLPSRDKLSKLVLSEACLKESLRKYSVVPTVVRQVVKPTQVGPHLLPKGTSVMIAIQAVHHDSKYWPNPMKFDPSRFVNEKPKPYTFLPFIDGPRNCLGQYLALLESKMVISLLVQRYHLELVNKKEGDPRHKFIVPISPDGRMDVKCRRRKMN